MKKIYQVFVSSTFEDLQEERKEVMQALLELDCMPAGMELFPASNDDQWTLIKRVIDACDYYLLIIGGRYGSTNDNGISYTQMEFEYALETGKPIISFLPKDPANIPVGKCETDAESQRKLEEFKKLAQKKLVKYWENPEQLGSVVSRSMIKLIKDFPADGWVKAGSNVDEKSAKEIVRLQNENELLQKRLEKLAFEAPKGTEILAQGEDKQVINYSFEVWNNRKDQHQWFTDSVECTWDELFVTAAPYLINEAAEIKLQNVLNTLIRGKAYALVNEQLPSGYKEPRSFEIFPTAFNTIKIQFKALGLICLSEKKRPISDTETYWKLTPYGDKVMTQLLAIRK